MDDVVPNDCTAVLKKRLISNSAVLKQASPGEDFDRDAMNSHLFEPQPVDFSIRHPILVMGGGQADGKINRVQHLIVQLLADSHTI